VLEAPTSSGKVSEKGVVHGRTEIIIDVIGEARTNIRRVSQLVREFDLTTVAQERFDQVN